MSGQRVVIHSGDITDELSLDLVVSTAVPGVVGIPVVNPDGSTVTGGGGGGGGGINYALEAGGNLAAILAKIDVNAYNETPGGAINSSNKIFTTFYTYKPVTTRLFLNGLRQIDSVDYTESGASQITFTNAPLTGDNLIIDYVKQ